MKKAGLFYVYWSIIKTEASAETLTSGGASYNHWLEFTAII